MTSKFKSRGYHIVGNILYGLSVILGQLAVPDPGRQRALGSSICEYSPAQLQRASHPLDCRACAH